MCCTDPKKQTNQKTIKQKTPFKFIAVSFYYTAAIRASFPKMQELFQKSGCD